MSRQTEIQELITKYHRRLQKLREKEATLGINTPPEILIEIEDIEAKVEHFQNELKGLEIEPSVDTISNVPEELQNDAIKKEKNSPVEILVAKIGLGGTIITAVLGLVGIGITAYFGYLGIQMQIKAPIEATQTAEAKATLSAFSVMQTPTATVAPTDTVTPDPTATPTPVSSSTPTSEPTKTPEPTETPVPTLIPSDTPTSTSTSAPVCPSPRYFQDIWGIHSQLGCPINALTSDFTFQIFEEGTLAWQKSPAPPTIYAFYNNGIWERQTDPGGPPVPSCPAAEQTNGLGPISSFGTLWCEPWNWKENLGLPISREFDGKNNQIQNFENGTILTIGEAGGFVLYSDGEWEKF